MIHRCAVFLMWCASRFNSIKVRLIHEKGRAEAGQAMFQFHKGSIDTLFYNSFDLFSDSFNSIKVRLIPKHADDVSVFIGFQFHKGSIDTQNLLVSDDKLYVFQFHKGSIDTNFPACSYPSFI